MAAFVRPGQRVLLKANLLTGRPVAQPVCTHPTVLRAVAVSVIEAGATPFIGDSPAIGTARFVARKCGIRRVADELGIEVVNFTETEEVPNPNSPRYRTLTLAREALRADAVINLPRVKSHGLMLMTMAVKNLFGCVVGLQKSQWHFRTRRNIEAFTEMLLSVYRVVNPVLTIADGIVAMEGNGPSAGRPRPLGILLASADAVSLDRVIGEVVGLRPEFNLTALMGGRLGVGEADLSRIEVIGPGLDTVRVDDFELPHQGSPDNEVVTWPLAKYLGDAAVTRPEIDHKRCTLCETCIRTCPAEVMSLKARGDRKWVRIDRRECIHCFCCQEVCPEEAITPRTGWLARLLTRNPHRSRAAAR
jgi:uncharacterized protein (DUF362 family)/ferredoxin